MSVYDLIEKYKQYELEYDYINKILWTREPMLVVDLVTIRKIINDNELDIKQIRIVGRD